MTSSNSEEFCVVRRQRVDTVSITINGTATLVCKKWINDNCKSSNCNNYHPPKKMCKFFIKGMCKWDITCNLLHPIELKPQPVSQLERLDLDSTEYKSKQGLTWKIKKEDTNIPKGCIIITIEQKKFVYVKDGLMLVNYHTIKKIQ